MANQDKLINPGERVFAKQANREGYSWRIRWLLVIASLIAFFFLPKFLTLHVRGLSLWTALCGGLLILWVVSRESDVTYAVTQQALYKLVNAKIRAWRIPLDEIIEIRTKRKRIIIRIPKKTFLLYNNPQTKEILDLIRTLRSGAH